MPVPQTGFDQDFPNTPLWTFDQQGNLNLRGNVTVNAPVSADGRRLVAGTSLGQGSVIGPIQPSGDTSGDTDTATIQAYLDMTGTAYLNTAAGPFYIGAANSSAPGLVIPTPGGWLHGNGGGSAGDPSPVYYLGTGPAVQMLGPGSAGDPSPYPADVMGGAITDLVIAGDLAGAGATGLLFGNGDDFYLNRLRVANFNGAGSVGIHESNTVNNPNGSYTEKTWATVQVFNNTVNYLFDAPGSSDNSHFYGYWDIHLSVEAGQTGVQFANQAGIRGGIFTMRGNFYQTGSGSGIGIDFANGGSSHIDTSTVNIHVETTGTGSATYQTIKFGNNASAGIQNCVGSILFADTGWTNSDLTGTGQFSFGGYINNNDPTLTEFNTAPAGWPGVTGAAPVSAAPGGYTTAATTPGVMAGLNQTITPVNTGLILVLVDGVAFTETAAVPFSLSARHGTGTPPSAGDAQTGARVNATADATLQAAAASEGTSFSFSGVIGPVTIGDTAWVDLAMYTSNASDEVSVTHVQVTLVEI
jgi:hypothetical protein